MNDSVNLLNGFCHHMLRPFEDMAFLSRIPVCISDEHCAYDATDVDLDSVVSIGSSCALNSQALIFLLVFRGTSSTETCNTCCEPNNLYSDSS